MPTCRQLSGGRPEVPGVLGEVAYGAGRNLGSLSHGLLYALYVACQGRLICLSLVSVQPLQLQIRGSQSRHVWDRALQVSKGKSIT